MGDRGAGHGYYQTLLAALYLAALHRLLGAVVEGDHNLILTLLKALVTLLGVPHLAHRLALVLLIGHLALLFPGREPIRRPAGQLARPCRVSFPAAAPVPY